MKTKTVPKNAVELLLPELAKEVESEIKDGFVPEKAVRKVYLSHKLLKNSVTLSMFENMLRKKFPKVFPTSSTRDLIDAAQRFIHMGTQEFLEDISSSEEYRRALNTLSR